MASALSNMARVLPRARACLSEARSARSPVRPSLKASVGPPRSAGGLRAQPEPQRPPAPPPAQLAGFPATQPRGLAFGGGQGRHATLRQMFLHRRSLARFRGQEAELAIYLQPYIPDDLGELAASEMPQLGSTQGLLDMMGGGSSAEEEGGPPRKQRRLEETALGARSAPPEEVAEEIAPTEVDPASSPASVPSSPASAPRAAVVPLYGPAATPGVSASASAEADSDDEFLQDLWRTPARSSKVSHDDGADWLADLLTTPLPEQARPASPPRGSGELASEEELHMLFSASVAECKGLPVEHWNFDEGKVHHPLHDLVDGAAFYIGATVNPQRRFLGGQSRGGSMPGHCLSWDRLTVLHLANGIGARRVETNLISYCKERYGHLCTNTAMDSRGVSAQEPAFVYVCTGQRQTPRPPRLRATPERGGARGC